MHPRVQPKRELRVGIAVEAEGPGQAAWHEHAPERGVASIGGVVDLAPAVRRRQKNLGVADGAEAEVANEAIADFAIGAAAKGGVWTEGVTRIGLGDRAQSHVAEIGPSIMQRLHRQSAGKGLQNRGAEPGFHHVGVASTVAGTQRGAKVTRARDHARADVRVEPGLDERRRDDTDGVIRSIESVFEARNHLLVVEQADRRSRGDEQQVDCDAGQIQNDVGSASGGVCWLRLGAQLAGDRKILRDVARRSRRRGSRGGSRSRPCLCMCDGCRGRDEDDHQPCRQLGAGSHGREIT